ncbi:MAG: hypothetical protein ACTS73_02605 [Arsenophonus sp. NEOnobi-MAG3]
MNAVFSTTGRHAVVSNDYLPQKTIQIIIADVEIKVAKAMDLIAATKYASIAHCSRLI